MKPSPLFYLAASALLLPFAPLHAEDTEAEKTSDTQTWLGVGTTPVASVLRDHLEIEEGFGIQIQQVMKDSPAAKAGLTENDILVKFEDQLLISPEHLSLLVKRLEKGENVSLTLIRKGAEQTVDVTLGGIKKDQLVRRGGFTNPHRPYGRDWEEAMKRQQDHWQDMMQKQRPKNPAPPKNEESKRDESKRPPAVSVRPGFPVQVFGSEGVIKIDNQEGEVTITRKEGDHHIEIRDRDGKVVHEGAYDPEAGVESLPEAAREQLKTMKLDDLEVLAPRNSKKEPEKTSAPKPSTNEGEVL
ncbi:MAG: hypothetical protein CMO55_20720 [Verrucomicrobiales bacterium]|nr:hypothetical protein [Verrucomicrobiales bacterium]